jgi:hypothetical protein
MYHGSIGALDLANSLALKNNTAEKDPNGFWFYPYGGLGIYRQNNWLLSFKGNSKYIWDFESSGTENNYGRFASAGALRILAGDEPISSEKSGYTIDGWNWNRLPGATTFDMPYEEMKSKNTRNFTPESYLSGISTNNKNGLVSMKYNAPLSSLSLNKSYFFFDDYVVALGTNINAPDESYEVQTTLYQNGIEDLKTVTSLNGNDLSGKQNKTQEQENMYLTDAQGHSYFIPGKTKISVEQKNQTAPLNNGKTEKSGDFASARIMHGTNPVDESYLYFIQINGGKTGAKTMANTHKQLFEIIQKDKNAHIVKYASQNSTGYALLKENVITNDNLLLKTDTPCLTMIQKNANGNLQLSVQNPELGKIDEMISYKEISNHWHEKSTIQPVILTINGNWELNVNLEDVRILENKDNATKIQFNCFDGKPIKVNMLKK